MNKSVRKVELWEGIERKPLNLKGKCICVTLSTGKYIEIEFFEREKGKINIRTESTTIVIPRATNSVFIGTK